MVAPTICHDELGSTVQYGIQYAWESSLARREVSYLVYIHHYFAQFPSGISQLVENEK